MATWEKVVLVFFALGLVFFMWPGVKASMEQSKNAPKDWKGALIPIGLVVLFVFVLISLAKG